MTTLLLLVLVLGSGAGAAVAALRLSDTTHLYDPGPDTFIDSDPR